MVAVVDVDLVVATPGDRQVLDRLLQLYEYDFSEYGGIDLDATGVFPTLDTADIWRPDDRVFFIKVDGRLAGFAYVTRHTSYVGEGEATLLGEFFVLRKYRRRGVGERAARTLFERFPGRWELAPARGNDAARAFWRRVIGRYTGGAFRELPDGCPRWDGPVGAFETSRAATD